jgi:hypothetical protein
MAFQDPGSDEGTEFLTAEEAAASGGHPAWQEILDAIPEQYREALMPTLEKWDKGVSKRFQSLHSKYEPLKQYEEYDPNELEIAINLKQAIEADPRAVWELLAQTYDLQPLEQGASEQGSVDMGQQFYEEGEGPDPLLLQTQQQLAEQAAEIAALKQARELEEAEEQLDAYVTWLHTEHGEFDDDYVVTLMANGVDGVEAVNRYNAKFAANGGAPALPAAPKVMGAGGGVPSRAIDPNTLSNNETKDLVAQMLLQAQQG